MSRSKNTATNPSHKRARKVVDVADQDYLATLDDDQRAAATAPLGPIALLAGPGSGKTRTLIARIAHVARTVPPSELLALTHTTKAAGELRERLAHQGLDIQAATIHAAAWRQVRTQWGTVRGTPTPELLPSPWSLVRQCVPANAPKRDATETVSEIVNEIQWAQAWLLSPKTYPQALRTHGRTTALDPDVVAKTWKSYNERKARAGLVDFADVLDVAYELSCRDGFCSTTPVLFVDEFQDVDKAQLRLIEAWLSPQQLLCAAGDPEQAIFGFKGGDAHVLLNFAQRFKGAQVFELRNNYRSTHPIVQWVNSITTTPRQPLCSIPGDGPAPELVDAPSETDEERQLVAWLKDRHRDGVPYGSMAVLYRFNAASARLESALSKASIPYQLASDVRFFDRPEIRAVLVPFGQEARTDPNAPGHALLASCAAAVGWDPDAPPAGVGPARQRWEAVAALMAQVAELPQSAFASDVLTSLLTQARRAGDAPARGVTLATIHAAKGLEWDAVWLTGLSEGQLPSAYATSPAELLEEQRLLYVALSRARRFLCASFARKRHQGWASRPSRFVPLLSANHSSSAGTRPSARASRRSTGLSSDTAIMPRAERPGSVCAKCKSRLVGAAARRTKACSAPCLPTEGRARHAELVQWRKDAANELALPPEKVASDRALFSAAALGTCVGVSGFFAARPEW